MKKTLAIFSFIFLLLCFYVGFNFHRVNNDIFSFLNISQNAVFKALNDNLANEINILVKDEASLKKLENFKIFSEIFYKIENLDELQNELKLAKLALFKGEVDDDFANLVIKNIYSPINGGILGLKDDILGLSHFASILNLGSNIKIDTKTGFLRADDFIYAKATLKDNYDQNELLKAYKMLKNDGAIVSGGAIFSAFGKAQGVKESAVMGVVGVILCVAFLLTMFCNFKIFFIFLAPIFGFVCGLSGSFLFFENVHILVIVISTSLVGLMLDFSCGWLGLEREKTINASSIFKLKRLFLLALLITTSGYLLFLLSPMNFLHQIAIFSVFGLFGSFLISYFLIPKIFDGTKFKNVNFIENLLLKSENFFVKLKFSPFYAVLLVLVCLILFGFADFKDDVRNYASSPKELISDAQKLSKISGVKSDLRLVFTQDVNADLTALSKVANISYLYGLINDPSRQELIKQKLKSLHFSDFNDEIKSEIDTLVILNESELKNLKILKNFSFFFENPNYIVINEIKDRAKFDEILSQNGLKFYDLTQMINENLTAVKINALCLKLLGIALAFILLYFVFDLKRALVLTGLIFGVSIVTLTIFLLFLDINIFVVFGVILASAVGVDYLLFALKEASSKDKIFGISVAGITSIFSFGVLCMSQTHAVFSFGASVCVAIFLNMLCAFILSSKYK
ncbi:hypothetical protein [Campylobacter mucosalis]|uniref:hypothetical protein n=1 Tax=Campylobacter mucosalis TaxID=202 RepID=UPI00146FFC4C|nr:hypothetical protein [Campylobacter mucosalis]